MDRDENWMKDQVHRLLQEGHDWKRICTSCGHGLGFHTEEKCTAEKCTCAQYIGVPFCVDCRKKDWAHSAAWRQVVEQYPDAAGSGTLCSKTPEQVQHDTLQKWGLL